MFGTMRKFEKLKEQVDSNKEDIRLLHLQVGDNEMRVAKFQDKCEALETRLKHLECKGHRWTYTGHLGDYRYWFVPFVSEKNYTFKCIKCGCEIAVTKSDLTPAQKKIIEAIFGKDALKNK